MAEMWQERGDSPASRRRPQHGGKGATRRMTVRKYGTAGPLIYRGLVVSQSHKVIRIHLEPRSPAMQDSTIWMGLDVHKESVTAAILEGESSDVQVVKLSSDFNKIRRLFRRLSSRGHVQSCYEASGAGFVLHRALKDHGYSCEVVAPSLIPRKPGDRVKRGGAGLHLGSRRSASREDALSSALGASASAPWLHLR